MCDPALLVVGSMGFPKNVSEYDYAGALKQFDACLAIRPGYLMALLNRAAINHEDALLVIKAGTPIVEAEKQLILRTLELTGQNKAETARKLQIDVKTLRNKLKDYGSGD